MLNHLRDGAFSLFTVDREGIDRFVPLGRTGKGEIGGQCDNALGDKI